jgi:guanosine-3',5'-bis(diphosphate) 3'-pyrophosphohydrolase
MPDSIQAVTEAPPTPPQPDNVDQLYTDLVAHLRELRPNEDLAPLEKAYAFASARHKDQRRVSGEPFMVHPLLVTRQLVDMHMDMTGLVTGLLHDVVEDTTATLAEVR